MTIVTRTDAIRDIARWWLQKFEKDWCIDGQPDYKLTKEPNIRFMAVDDAGWYNRLDVQAGRAPRISKVVDDVFSS